MESIRASKKNPCNFGSLLMCLFFYVQNFFPSKGNIVWSSNRPVLYEISDFISKMGDNFDGIMDAYFEKFKEKMQNRFRIPKQLVDDYEQHNYFLVDCDKVHIQVVKPRIAWVGPLGYEVLMKGHTTLTNSRPRM